MNEHPLDSTLSAAVWRELDPAPATVLTDAERERADAYVRPHPGHPQPSPCRGGG